MDVEPLDVQQAHGCHLVAQPEGDASVEVCRRCVASLDHADAIVLKRDEEIIEDKARRVLDLDRR